VFFFDGFDAVEDFEEGVVEAFGMSVKVHISDCFFCFCFSSSMVMMDATYCCNCSRASWLIFSRSALFRRGLMALASSSSNISSPSFNSTCRLSRGTIIDPLCFLLINRGRGLVACSSCIEDEDDEGVEAAAGEADDRVGFAVVGSAIAGMAFAGGNVIFGLAVLCNCLP